MVLESRVGLKSCIEMVTGDLPAKHTDWLCCSAGTDNWDAVDRLSSRDKQTGLPTGMPALTKRGRQISDLLMVRIPSPPATTRELRGRAHRSTSRTHGQCVTGNALLLVLYVAAYGVTRVVMV